MAFTITNRLSTGSNTDSATYTTASVAVTAGDQLWVCLSNGSTAGTADEMSGPPTGTLGSGLTWARAGTALMNSSLRGRIEIWWANCPSSTSGTLTFTYPNVQANLQWTCVTVTGADATNPVVQTKTLQTAGTNPSVNFDTAPLSTSMMLASLLQNTNVTATAGTGKTIIGTGQNLTTPSVRQDTEYDLTAPSTATAFVTTSTANKCLLAVEIREPASGDATVTPPAATATATAKIPLVWPDLVAAIQYPAIAAHRGGGGEAPEDTLYALNQSFAALPRVLGELDIKLNQSGTLVLMHDTTVDRVAAGGATGLVTDYTDAEWADLDIVWPIPPNGTPVPASFWPEVRDAFPSRVLVPEVSTSGGASALVADVVADPNLARRIIGQAFNKTQATTLAAAGIRTIQLYSDGATIDLAEDAANGMYAIGIGAADADLDAALCTAAHALGLKVWAYTVNTTGSRDTLFAMGVDVVFTDFPTALSAVSPTVSPPAATATAAAQVPTVTGVRNATVSPPAATATAAAQAPAPTGQRNAVVLAAVATAAAAALVVVGTGDATVSTPPATSSSAASSPTVAGERFANIAPPAALATANALTPSISAGGSSSVSVPEATASAAAPAPTATGVRHATVAAPAATSTAAVAAPVAAGSAVVAAPTGTGNATAPAPALSVGSSATVTPPAAAATAIAPAPDVVVSSSTTVAAPTATATAQAPAPVMTEVITPPERVASVRADPRVAFAGRESRTTDVRAQSRTSV